MEYCPNGTLAMVIKNPSNCFSDAKISAIALQLTQALAYMHERNVMHRDIKLENILFNEDYQAKLTDFGCCAHTITYRSTFCGTMEYIPPEMIQKNSYLHSVDLYSLGIVIYEMFYR